MRYRNVPPRPAAGFTVAELAIAITVFGIVSIGIFSMFLVIQDTQRRTARVQSANRAAQQQIEALRNNNYNQLIPGQTITFTSSLPANLPQPRSGTAVISEPTDGLRRVDVTVTYRDKGRNRSIKQSSLIGVIGISK